MNTKICSKCNQEFSIINFRKGNGKYRKKNYCIPCDDAYNKSHYNSNKDLRILQIEEWNEENPDKVKSYKKKWQDKNKK